MREDGDEHVSRVIEHSPVTFVASSFSEQRPVRDVACPVTRGNTDLEVLESKKIDAGRGVADDDVVAALEQPLDHQLDEAPVGVGAAARDRGVHAV